MVYPIGTVLFQLFRSYHSRMNKSSLLDNQHGILILFHFHDVTQRLYDQCGDRKYSDHLCLNRTEIQSNCNPDNQSGRNDISDWYSFISAISLIVAWISVVYGIINTKYSFCFIFMTFKSRTETKRSDFSWHEHNGKINRSVSPGQQTVSKMKLQRGIQPCWKPLMYRNILSERKARCIWTVEACLEAKIVVKLS